MCDTVEQHLLIQRTRFWSFHPTQHKVCGVKIILEIIRCKSDPNSLPLQLFNGFPPHLWWNNNKVFFSSSLVFIKARRSYMIWFQLCDTPFISCLSPCSFSNAPWTDAPCPTSNACLLTKCVPFIWLGLCSHVSPWSPCLKEQPSSFPCHLNPYVTFSFLQSIHHSWHHTINPLFV